MKLPSISLSCFLKKERKWTDRQKRKIERKWAKERTRKEGVQGNEESEEEKKSKER